MKNAGYYTLTLRVRGIGELKLKIDSEVYFGLDEIKDVIEKRGSE